MCPVNSHSALVAGLTVAEKARLTSGRDFWSTESVGPIPSVLLTDGPHGVRKQRAAGDQLGLTDSLPATCFPPAVSLGCTFDKELAERVGRALGAEALREGVAVLLGPGVNIKRSPLCGRNFEYFSEDPLVAGVMGAALVRGIQSQGVGSSLKHFAANNQETDRLRVSSDVDERPLREIYLRAFQHVVEESQPWTIMCSYNKINGVNASENHWLLTRVLREEWNFEGLVMSDWGAVSDRVIALSAGLDLEMPFSGVESDAQVVTAVDNGSLDEEVLNVAAGRVAALALRSQPARSVDAPHNFDIHHTLAREAAGRSIVLLKNENGILPLSRSASVAVIGEFAQSPRYQGAGSSLVNPTQLDLPLHEIMAAASGTVTFAQGFTLNSLPGLAEKEQLLAEAVTAASSAEVAVVFLGLPARLESEGFDRLDIDLPPEQLELLNAVVEANRRTVVVLSNGGVVLLPFADRVPAILEGWLLGQAGGGAIADVLYGDVNPSAKLTETIPHRLEDSPAFGNFPGELGHVRYGEGIFVGYRGYDKRHIDVAFPFGHGLSYTSFEYAHPRASCTAAGDVEVQVSLSNVGAHDGREIVQVYSAPQGSAVERPLRELKAFASIALAAGETRDATLLVRRTDLAYWDSHAEAWTVEGGVYRIDIGASSRDIRGSVEIFVPGDSVTPTISMDTTLGEIFARPATAELFNEMFPANRDSGPALPNDHGTRAVLASFPLNRLGMFGLTKERLLAFVGLANMRLVDLGALDARGGSLSQ